MQGENYISDKTIQIVGAWIRKHTSFKMKEDIENIVNYAFEFAWRDWNPWRGVPFSKFIWNRNRDTYLYISKAIERQLNEHGIIEKKWYREVPWTQADDDSEGHKIEDIDQVCDQEELRQQTLDPEELSDWFITEINAYTEHLLSMCEYEKLVVLYAMCTGEIHLEKIAKIKGLSHKNMTPIVTKICHDLADRTGLPKTSIKNGLKVIRSEIRLSSQLIIRLRTQEVLNEI